MIGTKYFKPLQGNELPAYGNIQYEVEDPETGEKRIETRREIIGYEENPAPNTLKKYSEGAEWCNANDAHIEDRGDFYEIVMNEHYVPTEAELAQIELDKAKAERAKAVANIKVTVDGMIFDGDESSQTRMSRAITASNPGETTNWVLADNTIAVVTREQLQRALKLAREEQTKLWVVPYTTKEESKVEDDSSTIHL